MAVLGLEIHNTLERQVEDADELGVLEEVRSHDARVLAMQRNKGVAVCRDVLRTTGMSARQKTRCQYAATYVVTIGVERLQNALTFSHNKRLIPRPRRIVSKVMKQPPQQNNNVWLPYLITCLHVLETIDALEQNIQALEVGKLLSLNKVLHVFWVVAS